MTTTAIEYEISKRILVAVKRGMTIQQAIDAVLGDGTYRQIADDVYDELNRCDCPLCKLERNS